MDDKQIRIVERLLKKLSALRATLSNDERGVLDHLIVGESGEVQAHALRPASVGAKTPAQDEVQAHALRPASAGAKMPAQDEVQAHALRPASVGAKTPAQDEVQAHALRPASVGAKMPAQDEVQAHMTRPEAGASTARWVSTLHIYWDSEKDEYRHD